MPKQTYIFRAKLEGFRGVSRDVAVRGDQRLTHLHDVLREAFEWEDDHLYSFWLSGRFWDRDGSEYTCPFEIEAPARSAATRLDRLGLEAGQRIAYLFDFGDEWRVKLTLREIRPAADGEPLPRVLASRGEAPPQYPDYEDEEGAEDWDGAVVFLFPERGGASPAA
jgi:hypothetical protein